MAHARQRSSWWSRLFGSEPERLALALELLRHAYVREKQHAMRYRQHAEKMRYTHFRERLVRLAQAEDHHAALIEEKLTALGENPPDVVPVHAAAEQNSWYYLRTDLEEEQRCGGELESDLAALGEEFSAVAELLRRIERDGRSHRAEIRDMLARSDPQAAQVS
jgi:rubrerythrin